jgi:SAM-dependent methyltransferase
MAIIPDSESFYDEERQLPQLQALLQIIRHELEIPSSPGLKWLDLGCGRGQVLAQIPDNIHADHVKKNSYFGVDGDKTRLDHARAKATSIGIGAVSCVCALLDTTNSIFEQERDFQLVTLTNTFHELDPLAIPALVVTTLDRLEQNGSLFVYDMQTLERGELGAITWGHDEIQALLNGWCATLKAKVQPPKVTRWRHSRIEGWSFELRRASLGIQNSDLPAAAIELARQMTEALELKLKNTMTLLNAMTNDGLKTPGEDATKARELYNFWGLTYRIGRTR